MVVLVLFSLWVPASDGEDTELVIPEELARFESRVNDLIDRHKIISEQLDQFGFVSFRQRTQLFKLDASMHKLGYELQALDYGDWQVWLDKKVQLLNLLSKSTYLIRKLERQIPDSESTFQTYPQLARLRSLMIDGYFAIVRSFNSIEASGPHQSEIAKERLSPFRKGER